MTAKEKAKELVEKFEKYSQCQDEWDRFDCDVRIHNAKQYALIAVDEIIEALEHNEWQNKAWVDYYNEVKQEIEKL